MELADREAAFEWADLQFHWDEAYSFKQTDGVFTATRIGQPTRVLMTEDVWQLRRMIRDDYAEEKAKTPLNLIERSSL